MDSNLKERIYKFDNIKLLAIALVVVGNVIEPFSDKSDMFRSWFIFIYSFHIPLFVFISGLFQQRFSDTNKLKVNRIAFYIILGFALKLINSTISFIQTGVFELSFFSGKSIEWYLFALVAFMVIAYYTRKWHPAVMLSIVFVLGCVCGYFNFIDDTLYLSRILVFMPFYFIGYYMTPQLLIKIEKNYIVKAISGASMFYFFVVCFRQLDSVYKLRMLMTGRNPFSLVDIENCGAQHRLLCYAISILLCMAVFCFVPNIKIPLLSKMGANTLSAYFWHMPILNVLSATAFFPMVVSLGDPLYKLVLLLFGVILTLILSFSIFMTPLTLLSKLIDKLKPLWCYIIIAFPFVLGIVLNIKEIPAHVNALVNKMK